MRSAEARREMRRERWYNRIAPMATVVGAVFLDLLWIPVPGFNAVAPAFSVMAVYCWTVWRPQLVPYVAIFVAGLLEDMIRGTPMGTASLVLLAVQGFVWAQKRYLGSQSLEVLWLGFVVAGLIASAATWAAISFAYRALLSPWPGVVQFLLSVAVFAPCASLLLRIERRLPRAT